jgi:hypothetical protein
MEFIDPKIRISGCGRTKVNFAYAMLGLDIFLKEEAVIKKVFGCSVEETMWGEKRLPRGAQAALEQIGRLITEIGASDEEKQQIVGVVEEAIGRGGSWAEIREHYRCLRLGNREGDAQRVKRAVLRALAEFRKTFPKTPEAAIVQGLEEAYETIRLLGG